MSGYAWLGVVDDFRTGEWVRKIKYPVLIYQEAVILNKLFR